MLNAIANKKLKNKKFNLIKRIELISLISWMGAKSRREKRYIKFFYYLENFRHRKFKLRTNERKKTLNKKLKFTLGVSIKQLKQKRKWRYWFIRKKRYRFNSYNILKNYCLSNFKNSYRQSFVHRKYKKKNYVKRLKRLLWNKHFKFTRQRLSWRKKKPFAIRLRKSHLQSPEF